MFTQPLMYQRIKKTKPILDLYQKKIIGEGVADMNYVEVPLLTSLNLCNVTEIFRMNFQNMVPY